MWTWTWVRFDFLTLHVVLSHTKDMSTLLQSLHTCIQEQHVADEKCKWDCSISYDWKQATTLNKQTSMQRLKRENLSSHGFTSWQACVKPPVCCVIIAGPAQGGAEVQQFSFKKQRKKKKNQASRKKLKYPKTEGHSTLLKLLIQYVLV